MDKTIMNSEVDEVLQDSTEIYFYKLNSFHKIRPIRQRAKFG